MYTSHFAYSSVHEHLDCVHVLAIVHNAAMNLSVQIDLRDPLLILLDIHPEVESLNHRVSLFLTFERAPILLSTAGAPSDIPTNRA